LVLNKSKDGIPPGAVFIGRPSKWGNPFKIGEDGTRDEVIAKHRAWILCQPGLMAMAKDELRGRDLVCFCAPRSCHGDILSIIANQDNGIFDTIGS